MYVITEWFERYEVNDKGQPARSGDKLRASPLIYIRSKVHGHHQSAGFAALQKHAPDNSYEVFGMFQKFLEVSGNSGSRFRGILLSHRGAPANLQDLGHILREKTVKIQGALEVLTHKEVGWMEEVDDSVFREFQGFQENWSAFLNRTQLNSTQLNTTQLNPTQDTHVSADALFDTFWAAWPKKVGEPTARVCFQRLFVTAELLRKMLAKVQLLKQTSAWKKEGGRYIPFAEKWLTREGWNDPIPEESEGRKSPQEKIDEWDKERKE